MPSIDTSITAENLLSYQPDYYEKSKVMEQINKANAKELTLFNSRIALIKLNYDIDTADSNTLTRWENEFKIKVSPNDSLDFRRCRVKNKFLGQGDFSEQMIKSIAKIYTDGDISVNFNFPNFEFTIKFISTIGIPPNFQDFKDIIEEVKPAYLNVIYEYYNTHKLLNGFTNEELTQYTHEQLREIQLTHLYVNKYIMLTQYTHEQLNKYTYQGLRRSQLN